MFVIPVHLTKLHEVPHTSFFLLDREQMWNKFQTLLKFFFAENIV